VKRVFVTGGSGFLGSAIVRRLVREGVPAAVLLRPTSNPWRIAECIDSLTVINGSFHKPAEYADALARFNPDTVFHLAWHGVGRSERDSPEQVRVNVPGTTDLFLASTQAGAKSFIAAGSQAEYGPSEQRIEENHPTKPSTLYGAAKLATMGLLDHLAAARAVRFAWLRVFSLYGPGDGEGTMITTLIRRLLAGERPAVTDGSQRWDYLHVDDAAAAFLAVARSDVSGVFNVGSGLAAPLREAMCTVRDLIDPDLELGFGEVPLTPASVTRLEPDVTRLKHATGWAPHVSMKDGLRETVSWHQDMRMTKAGKHDVTCR